MSRVEVDHPEESGHSEAYGFLDGLLTRLKEDQTLPRGLFGVTEAFDQNGYHVSTRDHKGFKLSKEDTCEEMGGGSCIVLVVTDINPSAESGLKIKAAAAHIHDSGILVRDRSFDRGLSSTAVGPDGKPATIINPVNIRSMLTTVQGVLRNIGVNVDIPKPK